MITNRSNSNTYYNAIDLNRVENKVAQVADLLTSYGYYTTVSIKNNWVKTDYPSKAEMKRYLGNVKKCVNNFCKMPASVLPYTMDKIDYVDANNIEKILIETEKLVDYMLAVMRYSGSFYCGDYGLRGFTV